MKFGLIIDLFCLLDDIEFLGCWWHFHGLFITSLHPSRFSHNRNPVYWNRYVCADRVMIQYRNCIIAMNFFLSRLHDVLPFCGSDHDSRSDQSVLFTTCGHYDQRNHVNVGRSRLRIRCPVANNEFMDFVAALCIASALDHPFTAETGFRECYAVIWMFA